MKGALITAIWIALAGCTSAQVTMLGPIRPARPAGCDLTVLPGRQPAFALVDIASARAQCGIAQREGCIEELRNSACAAGADVIYGFSESVEDGQTFIAATLAYRDPSRPANPSAADGPAPGECAPICSPGFACQAGTCIPECNPPCEANEVCNRHRTCEPAPPAHH